MNNGMVKVVAFLIVVFLAVPFLPHLRRALSDSEGEQGVVVSEDTQKKVNKQGLVTRDKFYRIQNGMTYEECVAIIGSEGKKEEAGWEGAVEYTWVNPDVLEVNLTFTNGYLNGKGFNDIQPKHYELDMAAVRRLEKKAGKSAVITIAEYEKTKPGMTYEECVKIIGAHGERFSMGGGGGNNVQQGGFAGDTYIWQNIPYNYSAWILFTADGVQRKIWIGRE